MKYLIIMLLATSTLSAQDSLFITRHVDNMSGKVYIFAGKSLVVANNNLTEGFKVTPLMQEDFSFSGLLVDHVGLGKCSEKNELIILFTDDTRLIKRSIDGFNCDGSALYTFTEKELISLKSKTVASIRFTNGQTYKAYTGNVDFQDYFMQLFYLLANKLYRD
jgi:hypothetical protein